MTDHRAPERVDEQPPVDPWLRWGWLMSAIWLVFLAFPISDAVTSDRSLALRLAAGLILVVFVVVYLHGFIVVERPAVERLPAWWPLAGVAALAVLTTAGVLVQGTPALSMAIFTCAYALLLTPLRLAVGLPVAILVVLALLGFAVDGFEEARFILPVALLVSVALALVRFFEERAETARGLAEEMSLVAERERVARDVHDVLGHSLTVVTAKAELAERLLDLDPERAREELRQIQALSREAIGEVRATVAGLRVARLGDELAAARTALAAAGIEAVVPDGPDEVDPRRRLVLAWVLREAVTNVVRHSRADHCVVELGSHLLVVTDDGRGRSGPPGNGLRGVEERVRAAGGILAVTDRPEGGTRLEVSWP